ncbi:hypothetical protein N665_0702s0008 [Sinapis alba]|nr:hypothetical protein N665_0702s0008 [Sinapis alba]
MWRIRMKMICLWRQYLAAGGLTIEMVLIDANFDPFLSESGSKIFINFSLNLSCGSYRSTNNLYKISFLSTTRVRNCKDLPRALVGFQPGNYRSLLDENLNPDYLVDVIVQIVEVTYLEIVSVNGKYTNTITIELHNTEDNCLPLVLWGEYVSDVVDANQVHEER